MPKEYHKRADPKRLELDAIKQRQRARKEIGISPKVTLPDIYQMGLDILENQARQENMLRDLKQRC